jgi:hypothetical protein
MTSSHAAAGTFGLTLPQRGVLFGIGSGSPPKPTAG